MLGLMLKSTHRNEMIEQYDGITEEYEHKIADIHKSKDIKIARIEKQYDSRIEALSKKHKEVVDALIEKETQQDDEIKSLNRSIEKLNLKLNNAKRSYNRIQGRNSRTKKYIYKKLEHIQQHKANTMSKKLIIEILQQLENRLDGDNDKK